MASTAHVAVGMAAAPHTPGRLHLLSRMAILAGLSMLPDADVLGFAFGVAYDDPFGHRGASHSLVFALGVGLLSGAIARAAGAGFKRWAVVATLVVASHGVLDALTDGGLGVAFFWPFSDTRHFFPWRPLPVAPIGRGVFSAWGARVLGFETLLCAPLFLYAALRVFRSRRR